MGIDYQYLPSNTKRSLLKPWQSVAILLVMLFGFMVAHANTADYPRSEDVTTLDGIMHAYYDVVSGPANTPREVARDLSLHHPNALMMVPDRDAQGQPILRPMSVAEFHRWGKTVYDPGFFERESYRTVQTFGRSTHVWSTYETRHTEDGPVVARGINSIQLYNDGKRYWILFETWDSEREGNPLPK